MTAAVVSFVVACLLILAWLIAVNEYDAYSTRVTVSCGGTTSTTVIRAGERGTVTVCPEPR